VNNWLANCFYKIHKKLLRFIIYVEIIKYKNKTMCVDVGGYVCMRLKNMVMSKHVFSLDIV
jgi:hypothetical protein